eukprot:407988-Alexandrium_andersonii.AAC.1
MCIRDSAAPTCRGPRRAEPHRRGPGQPRAVRRPRARGPLRTDPRRRARPPRQRSAPGAEAPLTS